MNTTISSFFLCPICNSDCDEEKIEHNNKITIIKCTKCEWKTEVSIRHEIEGIEGVVGHEGLYAAFN